ncbi:MAG TPA: FIST C-terminal domain-containing protein, partial [Polyangiaceae bacterium]|nr:FIST C-terminal domain-containing protein [Polyangiaceae bacterium]
RDVPIVGGSSADDDARGDWRQLANGEAGNDLVVAGAMFASGSLSFAYQSGYTPTDQTGTVTSAEHRIVRTIDDRPAAEVYNEWTDGLIAEHLAKPGSIFRKTTLAPVGRPQHVGNGVPHFLLAHPEKVGADGSLALFAAIEQGERIYLMRGSTESLIARAGRVARATLEESEAQNGEPVGALVVYCAGCMLNVRPKMERVTQSLRTALGEAAYLGMFTFGEQGCFARGANRHSNLMISVITFGNAHA